MPVKTLQPFDKGYLAGLVDGEAWLALSKNKGCFKGKIPILSISMTDVAPLQEAVHITGVGKVYNIPHTSRGRFDKPVFRWQISGKTAAKVITQLKPCLLVPAKIEAAEEIESWYKEYQETEEWRKAKANRQRSETLKRG
jgi:hypothetical protein